MSPSISQSRLAKLVSHHAARLGLHGGVAALLVALVLLIVASPFLQDLRNGDLIEAVLMTGVLLAAVPAVGARRRTMAVATVLLIPALVGKWVHHLRPGLIPPGVPLAFNMVLVAFVSMHLLRFILRAPRVDSEVLCAGIAGYLMVGILGALTYLLADRMRPNSFAFSSAVEGGSMDSFNALYFSLANLSTLGFGNIVPLSRVARMFAILEATIGMFYMAIVIARLVSLYSSEKGETTCNAESF